MYYLCKYSKQRRNPNDYEIVKADVYKSNLLKWINSKYPSFSSYDDPRRKEKHGNITDGELVFLS